MAAVKWIKIVTDIFDDEKMLLIESLPSADSIIVVWFKLLCLAGKNNNSGVFMLNERIAYTDEMLATIFRKDINIVRFALKTFEEFGMIELIDNVITIPNWGKHQTLDAYEKRKERDRLYQQKKREAQKLMITISNKSTDESTDKSSDESSDVVALEEEKEKEEDKEKEIYIYSSIVDYLNLKANTKYRSSSNKTKSLIKARINEGYSEEDFKKVIDNKTDEWLNTDMEKYLRPETLFGTKFESYLNQKIGGNINDRNSSTRQNIKADTGRFDNFTPTTGQAYELTEEERKRAEELI